MVDQNFRTEDIDVGKSINENITAFYNSERERLNLAKWVLLGIFILTIAIIFLYSFINGPQVKEIFDFYKVAVPPIVTLILGAYFKNSRE